MVSNLKDGLEMLSAIENVVDRIQNETVEKLSDASYLEYKLLPELGLNDRHMHQFPKDLHKFCGKGMFSWQYPNQFSKYLVHISKQKCKSYCEIGCHKGGTFIITIEYLSRFNSIERGLAVDNWSSDIMKEYCTIRPEINYVVSSSKDEKFTSIFNSHEWDLTLIDADHSYGAVKFDFESAKKKSKMIAIHDIKNILCPGTQQIWHEIKEKYEDKKLNEWCDQYDDVLIRNRGSMMGIGLLTN